jgi:hypothetical protein
MGLRCFFATNNAPTGTGSHISWNGKRRKMGLRSCPAEQPAKGSDYAADVGTESCCIEDSAPGRGTVLTITLRMTHEML